MALGPISSWKAEGGKVEVVTDFLFLGSKITMDIDCSHEIRIRLLLGSKAMKYLDSVLKTRHCFADKSPYSQGSGLPSDHVRLWELDCKEGRMSKNWCLRTVVLEKTPESPLDSQEIKPVSFKGNQLWKLIGRTDAEVEAPVFWSFDMNSWLIGKVPDAGKDQGQKDKRASEDEMTVWHHWCNGHELGQTLGDGEGGGGLVCCSPWGRKELDTIGWLNNSSNNKTQFSKVDKVLAVFHRWGNWVFTFLTGFLSGCSSLSWLSWLSLLGGCWFSKLLQGYGKWNGNRAN